MGFKYVEEGTFKCPVESCKEPFDTEAELAEHIEENATWIADQREQT